MGGRWLERHWRDRTVVSWALWPASLLYQLVMAVRHGCYRAGWLSVHTLSVPVIVIGNITVGGSGKTPLVAWTANTLKQNGWNPGIISRGYGGRPQRTPKSVTPDSEADEVGDEPVLLARRAACPVVVSPNRVAAGRVCADQWGCNVIVSDDGLQHLALGRDVSIAVVDGQTRYGNGFCLPAGPLRERVRSLRRVDAKVCLGSPDRNEFEMSLQAEPLLALNTGQPCDDGDWAMLRSVRCHAVAGIGNPTRFFDQLRALGLELSEHPFPDHHRYTRDDLQRIAADGAPIVMTEKDAVKCKRLRLPGCWYLPITASLQDDFTQWLLNQSRLSIAGAANAR